MYRYAMLCCAMLYCVVSCCVMSSYAILCGVLCCFLFCSVVLCVHLLKLCSRNAGSKESNLPRHISWTRTHCGSTRFSIFERLGIRCDLRGRRSQKNRATCRCHMQGRINASWHQTIKHIKIDHLSLTNQALRGPGDHLYKKKSSILFTSHIQTSSPAPV